MQRRVGLKNGERWIWRTVFFCGLPLGLGGCLVERTVTDGSGNVIYQEPEVHTPFESERKKEMEIEKKERELGWE
ncbi:MAG: hypothetical protein MUF86_06175 [Akkermansiaceae bacterium]|jgi:hypothetical protein|nr:hypothetical protein [Akkermansiaceae bacterium]MCU0777238.1 hypothetical protein [Akkermansiaceae bacterium]